jgi:ribonuclease G
MNGPERPAVDNTVKRVHKAIEVQGRKGFHPEKYEIRGKKPARREGE